MVCVGPGLKPEDRFSRVTAHMVFAILGGKMLRLKGRTLHNGADIWKAKWMTCEGCVAVTFWCYNVSHHMGKPTICIGENKGADQLRGNCEADQRLCLLLG